MYGLPETLRQALPLRSIISNISVTYKLSKWLAKHLPSAVNSVSPSLVETFKEFREMIKSLESTKNQFLSFDVNSFFTKVPGDETIQRLK